MNYNINNNKGGNKIKSKYLYKLNGIAIYINTSVELVITHKAPLDHKSHTVIKIDITHENRYRLRRFTKYKGELISSHAYHTKDDIIKAVHKLNFPMTGTIIDQLDAKTVMHKLTL